MSISPGSIAPRRLLLPWPEESRLMPPRLFAGMCGSSASHMQRHVRLSILPRQRGEALALADHGSVPTQVSGRMGRVCMPFQL